MILVLLLNGDVIYRCSLCDETYGVEYQYHTSPFWDTFNGVAVLRMLSHYQSHSKPSAGNPKERQDNVHTENPLLGDAPSRRHRWF